MSVPPSGQDRERVRQVVVAVRKGLVRHGIHRLLEQCTVPVRVQDCDDVRQLQQHCSQGEVDLLIVEQQQLQSLHGADAVRTLVVTPQHHPGQCSVLASGKLCGMLSESADALQLQQMLDTALDCVLSGAVRAGCGNCDLKKTLQPARLPLSPREAQIFQRIGDGFGPMKIAEEMGLSVKTVESYRDKIKQKLQLHGRDALLLAAVHWRAGYRLDGISEIVWR